MRLERASTNYMMRKVRLRGTEEVFWEVLDRVTGLTVISGLPDRAEAVRVVKCWEAINNSRDEPLKWHQHVH